MKFLMIVPCYPYRDVDLSGPQNRRCARMLVQLGHGVTVLAPLDRPRFPFSLLPRYRGLNAGVASRYQDGPIAVYRPVISHLPTRYGHLFRGKLLARRVGPLVRSLHQAQRFDAIISFDLIEAGSLAWRLGKVLGFPAAGWAVGGDIRGINRAGLRSILLEILRHLSVVFYQSSELRDIAVQALRKRGDAVEVDKHHVLPRGTSGPDPLPPESVRRQVRAGLNVPEDGCLLLYLGRIVRSKGLFELMPSLLPVLRQHSTTVLALVGASPAADDHRELARLIRTFPDEVRRRIHLLPFCPADETWQFFSAADLYLFPSYQEGMPNSLLEALWAGLPAVAFDIPAVSLLNQPGPMVAAVPTFDFVQFIERVEHLMQSRELRACKGNAPGSSVREHFSMLHNMELAADILGEIVKNPSRASTDPVGISRQ